MNQPSKETAKFLLQLIRPFAEKNWRAQQEQIKDRKNEHLKKTS